MAMTLDRSIRHRISNAWRTYFRSAATDQENTFAFIVPKNILAFSVVPNAIERSVSIAFGEKSIGTLIGMAVRS